MRGQVVEAYPVFRASTLGRAVAPSIVEGAPRVRRHGGEAVSPLSQRISFATAAIGYRPDWDSATWRTSSPRLLRRALDRLVFLRAWCLPVRDLHRACRRT